MPQPKYLNARLSVKRCIYVTSHLMMQHVAVSTFVNIFTFFQFFFIRISRQSFSKEYYKVTCYYINITFSIRIDINVFEDDALILLKCYVIKRSRSNVKKKSMLKSEYSRHWYSFFPDIQPVRSSLFRDQLVESARTVKRAVARPHAGRLTSASIMTHKLRRDANVERSETERSCLTRMGIPSRGDDAENACAR